MNGRNPTSTNKLNIDETSKIPIAAVVELNTHIVPNTDERIPSVLIETNQGDSAYVEIADLQDKLVWTGNIQTNKTVSLGREFEAGLYFIHATIEGVSVQSLMLLPK